MADNSDKFSGVYLHRHSIKRAHFGFAFAVNPADSVDFYECGHYLTVGRDGPCRPDVAIVDSFALSAARQWIVL